MESKSELTTGPIPRLIFKMTLPVSIGLFFNTMYNVVDTWYGGMISTQSLAAMSLSLPVFFIIISIGTGSATGTTALIGAALGAENREEAGMYAVQGISFCLCMALILSITGIQAAPFLFRLLGASEAYLPICLKYMNPLFRGAVFFMLVYTLNSFLNAQGKTRIYRNFLIFGFFLNLVLDPWFIAGGFGIPEMGVSGIALATVITQVTGVVYLGRAVYKTGLMEGRTFRDIIPRPALFREIARQGIPAGLNMMTIAIGIFVITWFIGRFGKEALAAYAVGMRVEQMILMPAIGLNTATLALVSQNYGAKRFDRVQESLRQPLIYGGIMMAIGGLIVFSLAKPFMNLFSSDQAVIDIGISYLRVEALTLYAYVILFISVAALQGVKRPMFAIYIGLFRQIIAPFSMFWLATEVFHTGISGIWWGICGITWTAAVIAFFYSRHVFRKLDMVR